MIQKYGPLETDQIRQLVDCHNQTGKYASNLTIVRSINEALVRMHYELHLVTFSPISKLWYEINDQNIHKIPEKKFISVGTRLGNPIVLNPKEIFLNRFGMGNEYVYVIYSSDARIESVLNNLKAYPVKVGKTNCIERRIEQLSESGPNTLTVGAVFCTNNSTELERYIHKKLINTGRHILIPGRREWFRSNISTVIGIYNNFIRERKGYE